MTSALQDLLSRRSSSGSLERPSESSLPVPAGESDLAETFPGMPANRVPSDDQAEGLSSESSAKPIEQQIDKGSDMEQASEGDSLTEAASAEEEPFGVSTNLTPSGIEIYYQAGPKRLYRIRQHSPGEYTSENDYEPEKEWTDVQASVSEVLDIVEKGGLPWWGMKVGVAGVLELIERGAIAWHPTGHLAIRGEKDELVAADVDRIVGNSALNLKGLLTYHRLTVNHVRDTAGDRGQAVHDAIESWATKGIMPNPEVYAGEDAGYVAGLKQFIIDSGVESVASEVMVGSLKHKYAGRYDLEGRIPNGADVVVSALTKAGEPRKRGAIRSKTQGGIWLLDVKTSKAVYDTHWLQLEAYEEARKECGYEPTIARGVIHVTARGEYELVRSKALFKDFKAVLGAWKALEAIKTR